ncbi:MnuA family membrane nuclease [Mesomycoplasma ovipneumoniae]|uniref:endonuclease/exonuclease/phosphatase family protein n=1 Tax=Mesomycoplasma ovipneumoniae TaxID=29562 RepID=UPI0031196A84
MKKAILFPLLFAGSATAVGAGGYYIYSTSTGEQTGKGVIINKSSQTSPRKDLSASVDETQKQEQNQENTQEPEKNVEKDLSTTVEETKKQEQNQENTQEPEKNVEANLSASVEETKKQEQNQEQNQEKSSGLEENVEKDFSTSVEETQKQEPNQVKSQEPEKNLEPNLSATVEETKKQDQNPDKTPESGKNVEKDFLTSVEETKKQDQNPDKTPESEKNVEKDSPASVDEAQKQKPNPGKSQESGKNLEKESQTSIDDTKKQDPNPEKSQESEKDLQKDNNQSIRVGFWNILKYTNKKKSNNAKTYALASIINSSGSDVVGLAEITTTGDGGDIVNVLEELNPSAGWKQITTDKYGKENQQEKYTFLYKSSLLETINFEPKSNPYLIQEGTKLTWARPVAAVKFKTKTNIKNDFTLAIGHFDAPGKYNGKSNKRKENVDSEAPGQGDQEANEARDLANVLAKIDEKDGPNNEIIFMGDTNILTKNTEKLFESTLKSYKLLLDKDEKTTLSSKFGEYKNSYDKIFYKGDLNTKNAKKYDLYSIFDNNIVDLEKYDEMRKQDKRPTKDKSRNPKDIERIKGISDHTMVYFDLELSESDKN